MNKIQKRLQSSALPPLLPAKRKQLSSERGREGEIARKGQGQEASCSAMTFSASSALSPFLAISHCPVSTGEPLAGTELYSR